ncbi:hypothetical protein FIBSPDRAFT_904916 [Athelia psychrophila]|uniref:Uncharacterized protein n=1 Tax=Athelia psychrophila TaxID=1759441 RepID=A0A167U4N9_9AGAM|nr:hypothetical protein FIBSPDRAFT_904916 [Fibularhizoctonia sp. CBS 109695]
MATCRFGWKQVAMKVARQNSIDRSLSGVWGRQGRDKHHEAKEDCGQATSEGETWKRQGTNETEKEKTDEHSHAQREINGVSGPSGLGGRLLRYEIQFRANSYCFTVKNKFSSKNSAAQLNVNKLNMEMKGSDERESKDRTGETQAAKGRKGNNCLNPSFDVRRFFSGKCIMLLTNTSGGKNRRFFDPKHLSEPQRGGNSIEL